MVAKRLAALLALSCGGYSDGLGSVSPGREARFGANVSVETPVAFPALFLSPRKHGWLSHYHQFSPSLWPVAMPPRADTGQ